MPAPRRYPGLRSKTNDRRGPKAYLGRKTAHFHQATSLWDRIIENKETPARDEDPSGPARRA